MIAVFKRLSAVVSNTVGPATGLALLLSLTGCSLLTHYPDEADKTDRFGLLKDARAPVNRAVTIRWNEHAVPYVEADNPADLAFGVGYSHAHLRLGQMSVLRMLAQGRISEMAGPIPQLLTIDHGLRMLDLCGSGRRSLEVMAPAGREWISNFTRGINWYRQQHSQRPSEFKALDLPDTDFSDEDVMCIARLASADLSWATYLKFLKLAEQPGWEQAYAHMLSKGSTDVASIMTSEDDTLAQIFTALSKSGSNSLAISGELTESGAAMIANDPHVGLTLPNFWFLIGVKSPQYQAVGLMIPGVPIIGVGRNEHIAWGGTNMRSISSHLMDVSELPENQITARTETFERRGWWSAERVIRDTPYGPVLTDLPYFDAEQQPFEVALDWIGRTGSDEISAFLQASRASNWSEFRQAWQDYRVSAFNMIYSDQKGNIGMIPAYGQPVLKRPEQTTELVKPLDNPIVGVRSPLQQPNPFNPEQGFIASANNKPFSDPAIPYAFAFSNSDRYVRMQNLVNQHKRSGQPIRVDDLALWQRDTYSANHVAIRDELVRAWPESTPKADWQDDWQALQQWNGRFDSDSRGALVIEGLAASAREVWAEQQADSDMMRDYLMGVDYWKPHVLQWLRGLKRQQLSGYLSVWMSAIEEDLADYQVWGDVHIQAQQPSLGMIPLLGSRYRLPSYPASGNNDTLFKGARQPGLEPQNVGYGSSARHISDLSDPDANWFVLHGGNDGWLLGPNIADQSELWRRGEYIRMPLTDAAVEEGFGYRVMTLTPGG